MVCFSEPPVNPKKESPGCVLALGYLANLIVATGMLIAGKQPHAFLPPLWVTGSTEQLQLDTATTEAVPEAQSDIYYL
jgi:hypothetical protein